MSCRHVLTVALLTVGLCGTAESYLHLPHEVYSHLAGEWHVEVLSPCHAPAIGIVVFSNTTATLEWGDDAPHGAVVITSDPGNGPLSLGGIAPFLASGSAGDAEYRVCETQANYLSTPKRPVQASRMSTTFLKEYAAVLGPVGATTPDCDRTPERRVVLRVVGTPLSGASEGASDGSWKHREAIQALEIAIDTSALPGSCSTAAGAADAAGEKKRWRRRRGYRPSGATTGEYGRENTGVASGTVVIRFARLTPPLKSFLESYTPSLIFAGLFIVYRFVHSFFLNRYKA